MSQTERLSHQPERIDPGWAIVYGDSGFGSCQERDNLAKWVKRQGMRLSGRDLVQSNRCRVQRRVEADYNRSLALPLSESIEHLVKVKQFGTEFPYDSCAVGTPVGDCEGYLVVVYGYAGGLVTGWSSAPAMIQTEHNADIEPQVRVLETLQGFVDQIEGDIAFVTLKNEMTDEEFIGQYDAKKLAELGIEERRRFICQTVEMNGHVEVKFIPVADVEISPEEEQEIDRRLDLLLAEDDLDGDY